MSNEESDFTSNVIMDARESVSSISSKELFDTNVPLRGFAIRMALERIDLSIKLQVCGSYSMNTEESISDAIHYFYVAWAKSNKTSRTT